MWMLIPGFLAVRKRELISYITRYLPKIFLNAQESTPDRNLSPKSPLK